MKSEPLIGAHVSIGGGVQNAFERGLKIGATAIQIFLKNASQWKARPYDEATIRTFKENWKNSGILFVSAHDSYLINLAAPASLIRDKSIEALRDELERAEQLGVGCLVAHPGSHVGDGESTGIRRIAEALNHLHSVTSGYKAQICLEATAGQGTNLGYRIEHLVEIMQRTGQPERLGFCLDTCHLFAAGYDFRSRKTYARTFEEIKSLLGLKRIKIIHVNDSRKGLGSRVDRHAHIGEGEIGFEAFRMLMRDPDFASVPKILETPKEEPPDADLMNLERLRKALGKRI
ncbi:MAG TPA: deoxyribonuclease IV [Acidobacteriota bacterium]|jgi:deoxyribonuclease-4